MSSRRMSPQRTYTRVSSPRRYYSPRREYYRPAYPLVGATINPVGIGANVGPFAVGVGSPYYYDPYYNPYRYYY